MPSSCAVAHEDGFAARDGERSSKPGPDAEYKAGASRLLACRTRIARSVPNFSVIGYADIGRELAPDLVGEAQAQCGSGRRRPDAVLGNILSREIELEARLEDQALGDPLVIIALGEGENIALVGQEQSAFDLKPVGRQSLDADGRVGTRRIGLEVVADAGLHIPVGIDRAGIESLDLGAVPAA